MLQPLVGHLRAAQRQPRQAFETSHSFQSGVRYLGSRKFEAVEFLEPNEMSEACVGNSGFFQPQDPELLKSFQMRQSGVSNLGFVEAEHVETLQFPDVSETLVRNAGAPQV